MRPLLAVLCGLFALLGLTSSSIASTLPTDHIKFEQINIGPDSLSITDAIQLVPNGFIHKGPVHTWYIENPKDDATWQAVSVAWGIPGDSPIYGVITGVTFYEDSKVVIRDYGSDEEVIQTTIHEIGHCVWTDRMSDGDKKAYTRLWKDQRRHHNLVTDYAASSEKEGFAEAFSYWITNPTQFTAAHPKEAAYLQSLLIELS